MYITTRLARESAATPCSSCFDVPSLTGWRKWPAHARDEIVTSASPQSLPHTPTPPSFCHLVSPFTLNVASIESIHHNHYCLSTSRNRTSSAYRPSSPSWTNQVFRWSRCDSPTKAVMECSCFIKHDENFHSCTQTTLGQSSCGLG
jgi:hypothetical protein